MTLSRIGCVICLAAVVGCAGAAPDTVITNAKIFTSNPAQPWAQAIAIRGERIVAVGDTATVAALAGSATRRIDAGGRTIIAGINDAHQHVGIAPPHDRLELPFDPTVEQIAQALRAQIATSPAGRLIEGEIAQTAWADPSFSRAWLDCDRARSPGPPHQLHRAWHAGEQPRPHADRRDRHGQGPRRRPLRSRRAGPARRPARGVRRLFERPLAVTCRRIPPTSSPATGVSRSRQAASGSRRCN